MWEEVCETDLSVVVCEVADWTAGEVCCGSSTHI